MSNLDTHFQWAGRDLEGGRPNLIVFIIHVIIQQMVCKRLQNSCLVSIEMGHSSGVWESIYVCVYPTTISLGLEKVNFTTNR